MALMGAVELLPCRATAIQDLIRGFWAFYPARNRRPKSSSKTSVCADSIMHLGCRNSESLQKQQQQHPHAWSLPSSFEQATTWGLTVSASHHTCCPPCSLHCTHTVASITAAAAAVSICLPAGGTKITRSGEPHQQTADTHSAPCRPAQGFKGHRPALLSCSLHPF